MPQLDWGTYPSQVFWLCISFVLLWWILSRIVLPPLQAILKQRQDRLASLLERADQLQAQAAELEKKDTERREEARLLCEQRIESSIRETRDLLRHTKEQIERESRDLFVEHTQHLKALKQDALEEVQQQIPLLTANLLKRFQSQYQTKGQG